MEQSSPPYLINHTKKQVSSRNDGFIFLYKKYWDMDDTICELTKYNNDIKDYTFLDQKKILPSL
jgi:hypothetical protein